MRNLIKNIISFSIAIVGLIGGLFWAFKVNWETEPVILIICSALEIIGFAFLKGQPEMEDVTKRNTIKNKSENNLTVNINNNQIEPTALEVFQEFWKKKSLN